MAQGDPNEQLVTAALTVVTWLLVAYTRCIPVLLLGMAASLVAVLAHCGLRRAPSEHRYKGRLLLGFTLRQLLGQGGWRVGVLVDAVAGGWWLGGGQVGKWADSGSALARLSTWARRACQGGCQPATC